MVSVLRKETEDVFSYRVEERELERVLSGFVEQSRVREVERRELLEFLSF